MKFRKSVISVIIVLVALFTIVGLSGLNFIFTGTQQDLSGSSSGRRSVTRVQNPSDSLTSMEAQKISLFTKDSVKIAANLYAVENPVGWIVFSHMMPATKESWDDLARFMENLGYESIAVDLRGHGESEGGPDGYKNFSDEKHQKSILDVEAAVKYLKDERGAMPDKIYLVGASIGANLSLEYLSRNSSLRVAILFSPGLNYRGVETEPLMENLKAGQKIFFISSRDDDANAGQVKRLYDLAPEGIIKNIKVYDSGGHGTDIVKNHPDIESLIADFIRP